MTISDLGNIGEFISSIAVIASLIYLSFQIRQNTKQLRRSEYNAIGEQSSFTRQMLIEESNAELLVKVIDSENHLSETEKVRLDAMCSQLVWQQFNIWDSVRVGAIDDFFGEEEYQSATWSFLGDEPFRSWWLQNMGQFPVDFRTVVNEHIDRTVDT